MKLFDFFFWSRRTLYVAPVCRPVSVRLHRWKAVNPQWRHAGKWVEWTKDNNPLLRYP